MPSNDLVLLERLLVSESSKAPTSLSDSELFEYFSASQILKNYDLTADQVLAGITDGSGDGGIDSVYTFANESLVEDDFNPGALARGYALDLYLIQSKTEAAFGEDPIGKIIVSVPQLLNLAVEIDATMYSAELIQRINIFRDLLQNTADKFPIVKVHVVYASKGSTDNINTRVVSKSETLTELIAATLTGSHNDFQFNGAKELKELASKVPSETLALEFKTIHSVARQSSHLVLVSLNKYAKFLTDDAKKIRRLAFEANVRDYQGTTKVNEAIRESLRSGYTPDDPDFWWLNNGVTILCTETSITGEILTLKDVQIVNGLQTSTAIYEHFKDIELGEDDPRVILVRVIKTDDDVIRNKIILATNQQNPLPTFAMRATDPWQKDIEVFFESKAYYYDRRKNYYKNQGKPAAKIITIPYLAQAVSSIGFSNPDAARARPSTLIADEMKYDEIFSRGASLPGYLWMAKLQKAVDAHLRASSEDQFFKSNMRFHLSMMTAENLIGAQVRNPSQLTAHYENGIDTNPINGLIDELRGYLEVYSAEHPEYTYDRIAKSREFTEYILQQRYSS
ncbi:MAG: hypothetical protein JWM81_557 [Candidatus Saccharibacteria bacterium]|nr:hypothetical protein [Candidatus Saccharibacteria bacterium]